MHSNNPEVLDPKTHFIQSLFSLH